MRIVTARSRGTWHRRWPQVPTQVPDCHKTSARLIAPSRGDGGLSNYAFGSMRPTLQRCPIIIQPRIGLIHAEPALSTGHAKPSMAPEILRSCLARAVYQFR